MRIENSHAGLRPDFLVQLLRSGFGARRAGGVSQCFAMHRDYVERSKIILLDEKEDVPNDPDSSSGCEPVDKVPLESGADDFPGETR